MGQEQSFEYYDAMFIESSKYKTSYRTSIYLEGWQLAAKRLEMDAAFTDGYILDVGCGTGQFAELLYELGCSRYLGLDFSAAALNIAKARIPLWSDSFLLEDVFKTRVFTDEGYTHACIFEVLEHLNEDISMLGLLRKGTKVLASVPNFWDPAHVRVFDTSRAVLERYESLIDISEIKEISLSKTNSLFMLYGVKL